MADKKMKTKVFSIVTGLLLFPALLNGQTSSVAYFMNLPQSRLLNPALKPANRFYIGLPGLSGINVTIGNNFLKFTDILVPGASFDSIFTFQHKNFDLKKFASKLNSKNSVIADGSVQLLGIDFPVGKNFSVMLDVNDRFTTKVLFPKSLLDLYFTGGSDLIGKTFDISDLNAKGLLFREYGAGFSGEIIHNLRIGARVKLLSGISSVSFDDKTFTLKVNNDLTQAVTANSTLDVAGQDELDRITNAGSAGSTIKNYINVPLKNSGFGFDFGAVYDIGRMLSFSVSVKDLGFINWKNDLKAWKASGSFTLPGITLQDVQNQTFSIDEMGSRLADSIKANFRQVATPSAFRTNLPTQVIAGASFTPIKLISFGVLSVTKMYAGSANQATTLSANLHLGQVFSATAAYTMANSSYNNLGFGMAVKAGVAQIYILADKIPVSWDKYKFSDNASSSVPLPQNFNMISFQFGINIVFGKQVAKKADVPVLQSQDNTVQQQQ
ncbi:MAG TPA: DUF5723 family protein [Bacteroidales bacterium]|nr:DUF5723 family protein [Bacteroidales bacterium]